ncbi:zinc metalloproteinase nas-6-like [Tubulanus polymorphus]|uniref:zinc metalloproteinase nas-6-like n=1 Tax=Tubulanus polymorphus TaxID=672921 RepID=UPI003DA4D518
MRMRVDFVFGLLLFQTVQAYSVLDVKQKHASTNLYQGDIDLSQMSPFRNGIGDIQMIWPGGTVPYKYEMMDSADMKDIESALRNLEKLVNKNGHCIKFKSWSSEKNFLVIFPGNGCSAPVGMTGGAEFVSLHPTCILEDKIQHEILHALGFWHEQSRPDRDRYITINWDNIQTGHEHNFDVQQNTDMLGVKYDYYSLMHYDMYTWSKNDKPTITPKDSSVKWTGAFEISPLDVEKIRRLYECR